MELPEKALEPPPAEPEKRRSWPGRVALWLSLGLPLLFFLWVGERGLDFGKHWDETLRWQSARHAIQEETLLPDSYKYPSVSFWVSMLALAPDAAEGASIGNKRRATYLEGLARVTRTETYHLRLRSCFLWLSSLSLIWIWWLIWRWRRRWPEALLGALALGLSWEVGYHSRWAAPDLLMMQFSVLCLVGLLGALGDERRRRWLVLAAIAAGLATGTKYNGGLLLLPVMILGAIAGSRTGWRTALRRVAGLIGIFAVTFLATTPGAVLSPLLFLHDVRYEMRHYATLGHYGFTVDAGWSHFVSNVRYLVTTGPSHFATISVAMSLLCLVGAVALVRESRSKALLLIGLPLVYLAYMSNQRVMFVRNLLFLAPFAAILFARGVGAIWDAARAAKARLALAATVGGMLLVNAVWAVHAADSIRDRRSDRFLVELGEYLSTHPETSFFVSPQVASKLAAAGVETGNNVITKVGQPAEYVVVYPTELRKVELWPGVIPGEIEEQFGPRDVNFEYYATWPEPRILVLGWEMARGLSSVEQRPWVERLFGAGRQEQNFR
jgi:4-amino-4-deoxy-L-arabinose transferase-like glycosyltransferase